MYKSDTIAAPATARIASGLAVIRVSGPEAFKIVKKHFFSYRAETKELNGWNISLGVFKTMQGEIVDEVIVTLMPSPASYTCEDVVEISCHGSIAVIDLVMESLIISGCRLAEPGEFTKRAFLNGRLDLSQVESVVELINAKTQRARASAIGFLSREAGAKFKDIKNELCDLLSSIEADIDFPQADDEIEDSASFDMESRITFILSQLENLLVKSKESRLLFNGGKVIIIGSPNVGKSSLLNVLLGHERAIVSDIPGTTRDTVEEILNINGIPVKLVDTAGLRKSDDAIESIGIQKTFEAILDADMTVVVIDGSRSLNEQLIEIDRPLSRAVYVISKADLPQKIDKLHVKAYFNCDSDDVVCVSALREEGIQILRNTIEKNLMEAALSPTSCDEEELSQRRIICLIDAIEHLKEALFGTVEGMPVDIVSIDIREALESLGELTGDTSREDVISRIFERFCIGK